MGLIKSIVGLLNRNQHREVAPKVIERKNVVAKLVNKVKEQIQEARNRAERRARHGYGWNDHPLHKHHFRTFAPLRPIRGVEEDRFGRLRLSERRWKRRKAA